MKLILAATPVVGHVNPVLYAGEALVRAGHEIVVTTASIFADKVTAIGARFYPFAPAADLDTRDVNTLFPERKTLPSGPAQLLFDFETLFVGTMAAQFATLQTILEEFPADVILSDCLFFGALPFLLSDRPRPRFVALGMTCLIYRRDDHAPIGPGLPPMNHPAQIEQYTAMSEQVESMLMAPVRKLLNQELAGLGARSAPHDWFDALVTLPDLYLQTSVQAFEYPRKDLPDNVHFVGMLAPQKACPMPQQVQVAIDDALAQGRKIVLVTQGTLANDDLGQLLEPTLAALAERNDLFVIATTGGRPVSTLAIEVPVNAMVVEFLPFGQLLPHVSVLITNGGYGTVSLALTHGIPMVVAGTTEDKPEIAARIEWSNTGVNLRTENPTANMIGTAVATVLSDSNFYEASAAIAREVGQLDTPKEIDRWVRSIWPGPDKQKPAESL